MEVKGTLEERISKSGNPYQVIMLKLTETYSKPVFLEPAELELLKAQANNNPGMPGLDDTFFK